jgi:hypothetical protein
MKRGIRYFIAEKGMRTTATVLISKIRTDSKHNLGKQSLLMIRCYI